MEKLIELLNEWKKKKKEKAECSLLGKIWWILKYSTTI